MVEQRAVEAILEPGRRLLELDRFWHYQSDGLVLFMAPEWSRFYRLAVEIPELVISAGRFHVKPFLSLLASDRRFYVLAVSQNEVRLLEGTRQRIEAVRERLLEVGYCPVCAQELLQRVGGPLPSHAV